LAARLPVALGLFNVYTRLGTGVEQNRDRRKWFPAPDGLKANFEIVGFFIDIGRKGLQMSHRFGL
jgi:hypothetical protein